MNAAAAATGGRQVGGADPPRAQGPRGRPGASSLELGAVVCEVDKRGRLIAAQPLDGTSDEVGGPGPHERGAILRKEKLWRSRKAAWSRSRMVR